MPRPSRDRDRRGDDGDGADPPRPRRLAAFLGRPVKCDAATEASVRAFLAKRTSHPDLTERHHVSPPVPITLNERFNSILQLKMQTLPRPRSGATGSRAACPIGHHSVRAEPFVVRPRPPPGVAGIPADRSPVRTRQSRRRQAGQNSDRRRSPDNDDNQQAPQRRLGVLARNSIEFDPQ